MELKSLSAAERKVLFSTAELGNIFEEYEEEKIEACKINEYKDISENQTKSVASQMKIVISKYLKGQIAQNTFGDMKNLDSDPIVDIFSDMLYYKHKGLLSQAANNLYKHFK